MHLTARSCAAPSVPPSLARGVSEHGPSRLQARSDRERLEGLEHVVVAAPQSCALPIIGVTQHRVICGMARWRRRVTPKALTMCDGRVTINPFIPLPTALGTDALGDRSAVRLLTRYRTACATRRLRSSDESDAMCAEKALKIVRVAADFARRIATEASSLLSRVHSRPNKEIRCFERCLVLAR